MEMASLERVRVGVGQKVRIPAGTTLVFVKNDRPFHRYTVGPQDGFVRRVEGVRVYKVTDE
jgi:hypothetical protein